MTTPSSAPTHHIHVEPRRGFLSLDLADLSRYRELLFFLIWRDIKVRYQQSVLGILWAVLQPFLQMVIFTFVFGHFVGVSSGDLPYPIFAYSALLPWQYFANAVSRSGSSLVADSHLISKVYFPRIITPLAAAIAPLVDFAIAFLILIVMMIVYGIQPTWGVLLLPLLLLLAFFTAFSFSLWFSSLNVRFRDVALILPFFVQAWMYLSPVIYSSSEVPTQFQWLYRLNPMTGVIEGFRWALTGSGQPPQASIWLGVLVVVIVFVSGLAYFRSTEDTFADVI